MYCKLCGKHLYEEITFHNIFKWNYEIHYHCLKQLKTNNDFMVIPVLNKFIKTDYLFPIKYHNTDEQFLFKTYGSLLFDRLEETSYSILLIDWDWMTNDVLTLLINLVEDSLLVISVFDENLH